MLCNSKYFNIFQMQTTTAQLKKLVGQNPSLEVINVHIQGYEHDKLKAKQVLKLIKKLQKTKEREFDILVIRYHNFNI